jgi:hypothetical protein
VYEVEVGYPVVGYQQTKGHVEQGRVHQVHLPLTKYEKLECSYFTGIRFDENTSLPFCTSCVYVFVVKSYLFIKFSTNKHVEHKKAKESRNSASFTFGPSTVVPVTLCPRLRVSCSDSLGISVT